jgi:hypothetical protein
MATDAQWTQGDNDQKGQQPIPIPIVSTSSPVQPDENEGAFRDVHLVARQPL